MSPQVRRLAWPDHARAMCMALVVLFHTPPRHAIWDFAVLFNIGVPLFFFFSGLLFDADRHGRFLPFLRHRCRQLLVPYLMFTAVFYVLWLLVGRRLDESGAAWWEPLWQTVAGYPDLVIAPFWFVTCLFTMQIIHWLLHHFLRHPWRVVVASVVLWAVVGVMPDVWQWNVRRAFVYIPLYAVGNALRPILLAEQPKRLCHPLLATTLAVIAIGGLYMSGLIDAMWPSRQVAAASSLLLIPAAVALPQWTASRWGTQRVATVIAANGITYLALQNYVIGVFKILIDMEWWYRIPVAIAVLAVIYPIAVLIERHLPWMLGRGPLFEHS